MERQEHLAKKRNELYMQHQQQLENLHKELSAMTLYEETVADIEVKDDASDVAFNPRKASSKASIVIENKEKHKMSTRARDTTFSDSSEPEQIFPQINWI